MADNEKPATAVNQKLTEEYKGKKYRRPDGKLIIVSHILEIQHASGRHFFRAVFDVIDPDPTTAQGDCSLDALLYMFVAADDRPNSATTPHSSKG
jgi:hypothetical protein